MSKIKARQISENVVISEVLLNADVTINRSAVGTVTLASNAYPKNPNVTDGRSRKVVWIVDYSKGNGASSTAWQMNIGTNNIIFNTNAMGNAIISNDTYVFELKINFRSPNKCNIIAQYTRYKATSIVSTETKKLNNVNWVRTISNNIELLFQIVTTAPVINTVILQQQTSELI